MRPFAQIDVFTAEPLRGNPVAVVLDADGLSDEDMSRLAHWTNLSETTFVLPPEDPGADYRVRIFTPVLELPFAGHPTLGTAHAWLEAGGVPAREGTVVQECGVGLVTIDRGERLAFAAPPRLRSGPVDDDLVDRIAGLLRLPAEDLLAVEWVDNGGPGWVAALLRDADAVLAARPAYDELDLGLVGLHPAGSPQAIEVWAFFPQAGAYVEDPVTGSLNASVAQWLLGSGRVQAPYVAAQGTALGRAGRVHVREDDDGTIWIGGDTVTVVSGDLDL
ncbi:MAG TPA: PhzF family phenazine biosynthesis protein [Acidimicrobiales bacterium]|nr:PhzF family phenazine biosynthesis protein [Acidimicrobiales bacterium]